MTTWSGPTHSPYLVVLAPGDSGRLVDAAPTQIADGLSRAGLRVARFAAIESDDDQVRDHILADRIRAVSATRSSHQRLVLAGLSRGARVSAGLLTDLDAVALLAFAYPFHGRSDPNPGPGLGVLRAIEVPALLVQGTRDSHGNREQVLGYDLPDNIHAHWILDANHALRPRARSGQTQASQLCEATQCAARFVLSLDPTIP